MDWWVPLSFKITSVASNQIGWPLNHGPGKKAEVLVFKSPARSVWPFSQLHDTSERGKTKIKKKHARLLPE